MRILGKLFGKIRQAQKADSETRDSSIPAYAMDAEGEIYIANESVAITKEIAEEASKLGYTVRESGLPYVCASLLFALVRYHDFDFENKYTILFVNSLILHANYEIVGDVSNGGFPIDDLYDLMEESDQLALQVPREFRTFLTATYLVAVIICRHLIVCNLSAPIPQDVFSLVNDKFRTLISKTLNRAGFPECDEMAVSEKHIDSDPIALVLYNRMKDSKKYIHSILGDTVEYKETYNQTLCGFYCACIASYFDLSPSFIAERVDGINTILEKSNNILLSPDTCVSILNKLPANQVFESDEIFVKAAGNLFTECVLSESVNRDIRNKCAELRQFGMVSVRNLIEHIKRMN